ncbi:uncharacterized protein LOC108142273 isoform X2 [Drosophila elegans]|uniref:uncharacterized protein LOC108142273 isoform X2 n=1 Tax=Drosophila elegans TaxID=30023 RepID=UPI0007E70BE5|nr:uncharacterized protein LOC108142273 isoform X2 [Drosophila elegans]
MSLKFNEAIEMLIENLSKTIKPEQETYMQDAAEISEKINQELIYINSIFKGTVTKWDQTYMFAYKPYPKARVPILWVEMPFAIEPQNVYVHRDPGCRLFNLKTTVNHPAVDNGYVNGEKLTKLFYFDLNRVVDRMTNFICKSGKMYNLRTNLLHDESFIIVVKEYGRNGLEENELLIYEFKLTLKFSNNFFLYTYRVDFFKQAEKLEVEAVEKKVIKLLTNVKKLFLQLQDENLVMPVTNFAIDSLDFRVEPNTGEYLLAALSNIIPIIPKRGRFVCILGKLMQFKESDSVTMPELKALFGLP